MHLWPSHNSLGRNENIHINIHDCASETSVTWDFLNIENRASYLIVLIKVLIGNLTVGRFHAKKECRNHV